MILFPAIDLKNGECVRLLRGDMAQATVFNTDPADAGAGIRRAGIRISACRRSRRRLRRRAGQRRGGQAHPRDADDKDAARRRRARHEDGARLAGERRDARHHRHRRGRATPISYARRRGSIPSGSPSASTRGTAASRSRAGPRAPTCRRSISGGVSRTRASRRSSTPTSRATALSQGLNIASTVALAEALTIPVIASGGLASIEDIRRLTEARLRAPRRRDRRAARSMTAGSIRARRWPAASARGRARERPMLKARVIPCLDVKDGRVVKGVNFVDLRDAGDPVECAIAYDAAGADELCFLDITASHEDRGILLDVVRRTAEVCFMPLTVGGGVRTTEDIRKLLLAGADKASINSAAVADRRFVRAGGGEIRQPMRRRRDRRQARLRAGRAAALGNLHPWRAPADRHRRGRLRARSRRTRRGRNPADLDGSRRRRRPGFDIELTRAVADAVPIPVIASGGVGKLDHLVEGVRRATPARCSPPRSSISANSRSGRRRRAWRRPGSPCAWIERRRYTLCAWRAKEWPLHGEPSMPAAPTRRISANAPFGWTKSRAWWTMCSTRSPTAMT